MEVECAVAYWRELDMGLQPESSAVAERNRVLLEVVNCPVANPENHVGTSRPCSRIVLAQEAKVRADFQLPEPWRGDIQHAPLLFVSSNPGFSPDGDPPRWGDSESDIIEYYGVQGFPTTFPYGRTRNGDRRPRPVRFWEQIAQVATELYRRDDGWKPSPGVDFALTEVVHCKAKNQVGVKKAVKYCHGRHLTPSLGFLWRRLLWFWVRLHKMCSAWSELR
jgi:hypothetical protein